jgi:hypothetical protein
MQRAAVLAGDRREISPRTSPSPAPSARARTPTARPGSTLQEREIEALERREIGPRSEVPQQPHPRRRRAPGLSRRGLLKKLERFGLG